MKKSDELKLQISAKREEVERLQKSGDIAQAAKVADELNALCDEFSIVRAKDKHDLANFLDAKDRGEWTVINPSNDYDGRIIPAKATATTQYRDAMIKAIRQNFKGELEPVLKEGVDANGGFLLPLEMDATISQKLEEENVMRQICTVIQTESRHRIPLVLNKPQAKWVKELERIEFSDETFADVELDAYKMAVSLKVSNELLADNSYNLEQHFIEQFTQTIAATEEDSFINGNADSDTSNRPTGFLVTLARDSDTSTIQASAGGVSESLNFDDLFKPVYSLPRAYRKNAKWLMHDSTLQMIRRLKDTTQNYLWTPSNVEGEPDKLLGYPVYTSPFFPAAQNAGDVAVSFGDFSRYVIADRAARIFRPLRELYAQEDATAFVMIERVDGALIDKDAIKILTLSRRAGG